MNTDKTNMKNIAILGGGNIGTAMALGLVDHAGWAPENIFVTRRTTDRLARLTKKGVITGADNKEAVRSADIIILAVRPRQLKELISEIKTEIDVNRHIIGSVITSYALEDILKIIGKPVKLVRIMPNTAISTGESMTCLAAAGENADALGIIKSIFDRLGTTLVIEEGLMSAATILCACGIAFFLRSIRAVSQGGIQVGFHADEAQLIAAQTARGAASLLLGYGNHPEDEIDKVTTPRGCTITGLNEMEHNGLSSALIKGIVKSYDEIAKLK